MNRRPIGLIRVVAALVAGCTPAGAGQPASRDPARWAIFVPPGWHVLRFSDSKGGVRTAGIELSNVRLPAPVLVPRTPAEVNGEALPPDGVGLVISTAIGLSPGRLRPVRPPLPLPWPDGSHGWLLGSSTGGSPVSEWLWFRIGRTRYVAAAAIGSEASKAATKALGPIVRSIKPESGHS
jgi:hypothetical protein